MSALRKPFEINESKQIVRITSRAVDNNPGIESQFGPDYGCVKASFAPDKLGLTENEVNVILKIVGDSYDGDTKMIQFEVKDFPFKEQNEKRTMQIIRDLISYAKVKAKNHSFIL